MNDEHNPDREGENDFYAHDSEAYHPDGGYGELHYRNVFAVSGYGNYQLFGN